MRLTVHVTEKHIREGRRSNCDLCPVALALKDASGKPWNVGYCGAYPADCRSNAFFPLEVTRFIRAFDAQISVEPFTFTLDLPDGLATENLAG